MEIRHVEELAGISKKNIRFYEEQGLLCPGRSENGYRAYSADDVHRLKQIKLLRKLGVPIEQIRQVLLGGSGLDACMLRRIEQIERQKADLMEMRRISEALLHAHAEGTDCLSRQQIDDWLEQIERSEQEGRRFMNVKLADIHRKKTAGAVLGAFIMIALMGISAAVMLWGNTQEPVPLAVLAWLVGVPVLIIICVIVVLAQRVREIKGGEEDEASQY